MRRVSMQANPPMGCRVITRYRIPRRRHAPTLRKYRAPEPDRREALIDLDLWPFTVPKCDQFGGCKSGCADRRGREIGDGKDGWQAPLPRLRHSRWCLGIARRFCPDFRQEISKSAACHCNPPPRYRGADAVASMTGPSILLISITI